MSIAHTLYNIHSITQLSLILPPRHGLRSRRAGTCHPSGLVLLGPKMTRMFTFKEDMMVLSESQTFLLATCQRTPGRYVFSHCLCLVALLKLELSPFCPPLQQMPCFGTPPSPRYFHSCCLYGNKLYTYGGYSGNERLADMYGTYIITSVAWLCFRN